VLRAPNERSAPSVIGPDLTINGNLFSKGEMQIDGEVQGDIRGTNIIIGERARITGMIIADEAVIRGEVMGSIRSKRVMLQAQSRVEGDIYHQTLAIEQGAYFEGKSRRTDDPTAGLSTATPTGRVSGFQPNRRKAANLTPAFLVHSGHCYCGARFFFPCSPARMTSARRPGKPMSLPACGLPGCQSALCQCSSVAALSFTAPR